MRGSGSLATLLGKPKWARRTPAQDAEPDLATTPPARKRGKRAEQERQVAAAATGQRQILQFFQVAAASPAATSSQQQQQQSPDGQQHEPISATPSPPPPAASQEQLALLDGQAVVVLTRIVGLQHQSARWPPQAGRQLVLQRQPANPVDPHAILVGSIAGAGGGNSSSNDWRAHGHLPATVAAQLAPLLDAAAVSVSLRAASNEAVRQQQQQIQQQQPLPALVQLQVSVAAEVLSSSQEGPGAAASVAAAVERAVAAGRASLMPTRSHGTVLADAFEHILQQTRAHDAHLLSDAEARVLHDMQVLPAPCKALLLRLLLRRRTWFQLAGLTYADVPEPQVAASRLHAVGLLLRHSDAAADLGSLLEELSVPILRQVLAAVLPRGHPALAAAAAAPAGSSSSNNNKAAAISSIRASAASGARLQAAIEAAAGACVTISPQAADTFARLQLLYFASPGQDISMFVAVERGRCRYPTYPINRARSTFNTRAELLAYERALAQAAQVDEALEAGDHERAWQCVQPALAALRAGVHKAVVWDEASTAPMPNPPPRQAPAAAAAAAAGPSNECQRPFAQQQQQEQQPQEQGAECRDMSASPSTSAGHAFEAFGVSACPRSTSGSNLAGMEAADTAAAAAAAAHGDDDDDDGSGSSVSWDTADSSPQPQQEEWPMSSEDYDDRMSDYDDAAAADEQDNSNSAHHQQQQQPPGPPSDHAAAAAGPDAPAPPLATPAVAAAAGGASSPPPLFLARFSAGWVAASLGTVAVSLLEKQRRWDEAVELLRLLLGGNACVARRGDWWCRLAINLEHMGRVNDALEAVEAALADGWVRGGDLLGLQRRLLRLAKPPRRWKRPAWAAKAGWEPREVVITGRPLSNDTGLKSRFFSLDGTSQVGVEELALQHYASSEGGRWQGLHSEGGVWAMLFGLLLWDVLFMGVPDVFRSPFQTGPLDLDTDAFYAARRDRLDAALSAIADGQAGALLSAAWDAHAGKFARGVNWQRFTKPQLLDIVACVGGLGLAAVLRLMAEDHAGATGGLPDLLLWRPADGAARCVEVKGPRDRLSHQQRFWLAHMADNTVEVEVLRVREPAPTKAAKGGSGGGKT